MAIDMNEIDQLVEEVLAAGGVQASPPCTDEVFVRRAYLDVTGTLPEPEAARAFVAEAAPDKRERLIEELLGHRAFADYWTLKWCDLLRVKSEFPINLWPKGVQTYHRWILESVRSNRRYDEFVRAMLVCGGSAFREGPVNFYRAVQGRQPADIAAAVALTFMGVRLERWPKERRDAMAAFFSQIAYKKTGEWKEEVVVWQPKLTAAVEATLPDGGVVRMSPEDDPRRLFADWLIRPDNPHFTRPIVNRVWSWFFGRGIVHEPDDLRPDNPPVNEKLLAHLERQLVELGFDLRKLFRLILTSATYQRSSIPTRPGPEPARLFACYPVRRLDAEVLADALAWIGGYGESYSSPIPEPFTYIPADQRAIQLADGSISSPFLEMFGRPARDTGLESERNNAPSDAQRLHLLNSSDMQQRITRSPRLRRAFESVRRDQERAIRAAYQIVLSRQPIAEEMEHAKGHFGAPGLSVQDGAIDLAWALINSKEFLFRH